MFFSEELVKREMYSLLAGILEWSRWVSLVLAKRFPPVVPSRKLVPLQNGGAAAAWCGTGW